MSVAVGVLAFAGQSSTTKCCESSTRASSESGLSSSSEDIAEVEIKMAHRRLQARTLQAGNLAMRRGIAEPTTLDDLGIDMGSGHGATSVDSAGAHFEQYSTVAQLATPTKSTSVACNSAPGYAVNATRNLAAYGLLSSAGDASLRNNAPPRCDASQRSPAACFAQKTGWCAGGDASQRSSATPSGIGGDASQRSPAAAGGSWSLEAASWGAGTANVTVTHGVAVTANCNTPCSGSRLYTEPSPIISATSQPVQGDASQRGTPQNHIGADTWMSLLASVSGVEALSCKDLADKLQAAAPEIYED